MKNGGNTEVLAGYWRVRLAASVEWRGWRRGERRGGPERQKRFPEFREEQGQIAVTPKVGQVEVEPAGLGANH